MTHTSTPVLKPGILYLAGDRFACIECAGGSVLYTGRTIHGVKVRQMTPRDIAVTAAEFTAVGLELSCECGTLRCAQ